MPPVMYGKTKRPIKVKIFDHLENSTLTGKINSGVHYAISEPFLFNNHSFNFDNTSNQATYINGLKV